MSDEKIVDVTTYKFERVTTYTDGTQYTDVKIFTEDANDGVYNVYWPDVANSFLLWLGSCFGYDVRGKVKLPDDMETRVRKLCDEQGVSYDDL